LGASLFPGIATANSFPTPPVVTPFGNSGANNNADAMTTAFANLSGTLKLTFPNGSEVTLNAGDGVLLNSKGDAIPNANGGTVRSLTELIAVDNGGLKQALLNAVKAECIRLAAGGDDSAAARIATSRLAALMQVVSKADPAGATGYVSAAVESLTAQSLSSSFTKRGAVNAITVVVAAAQQGTGGSQNDALVNAASGATQNGVVFNQNVFSQSKAAAAGTINTTAKVTLDVTVRSGSGGPG
jgi:hypothetical protein